MFFERKDLFMLEVPVVRSSRFKNWSLARQGSGEWGTTVAPQRPPPADVNRSRAGQKLTEGRARRRLVTQSPDLHPTTMDMVVGMGAKKVVGCLTMVTPPRDPWGIAAFGLSFYLRLRAHLPCPRAHFCLHFL